MTITITLDPSGPTKRRIIELAFGDLAMTGYEFGRTPEEVADAMDRLDALMYEWPYSELGFAHSDYGTGSAEELSGIPFDCMNAVAAALALRLAAAFGREFSGEARGNLSRAMMHLHGKVASVPSMPFDRNSPAGAGHRGSGPFLPVDTVEDSDPDDPGDLAGLLP
jgi:hypothetical protein